MPIFDETAKYRLSLYESRELIKETPSCHIETVLCTLDDKTYLMRTYPDDKREIFNADADFDNDDVGTDSDNDNMNKGKTGWKPIIAVPTVESVKNIPVYPYGRIQLNTRRHNGAQTGRKKLKRIRSQ